MVANQNKRIKTTVLRDSIHGDIQVYDSIIKELIDTREFQRLRRIKQLGTSRVVFHGSEHSRFTHSVGVYEIVRRIVDGVFVNEDKLNEDERLLALCAGLLHDIGHGPFSHSFEKVFGFEHEEYSRMLILGDTEVNEVLKKVSPEFPMKVSQVIGKEYENKLVVGLVSGQIDADRMDYLLRDAYHTGVSYGRYDIERLLRVIIPSDEGLLVKESGKHVVEDFILSRYYMFSQVYLHPVSVSAEVILLKIFKRVKFLYENGEAPSFFPSKFSKIINSEVSIEDFIKIDDAFLETCFNEWTSDNDEVLSDLCSRFVNRKLFKPRKVDAACDGRKFERLPYLLSKVGIDPEYYFDVCETSLLAYEDSISKQGYKSMSLPLLTSNGSREELSKHSIVVNALNGESTILKFIFVPIDVIRSLPPSDEKVEILSILG